MSDNRGKIKDVYTLGQIDNIYNHAQTIIDNLDEEAVLELCSGKTSDIDYIFDILIDEVGRVLHSNEGKIKNSSFGYVDVLSKSVEENLRKSSFNYFLQSVIPDFIMNWHHVEWGNFIQIFKYLCVIAARDHSKSFTFSFGYPLWKMYRYQNRSWNGRVPLEFTLSKEGMLITNEYRLAKRLLRIIKDEIESNPILRDKLYPETREGWAKEEIKCKNGAYLSLKSKGSSMRGPHPGYIIVDDFLDESSLYSQEQREKSITTFHSEIMNMVLPQGQVCVVGTPFHKKDLYADLKQKPKWKVFEYPAIFPDGTILWDHRYDIQALIDKKDSQGSINFSREILVRPVSSESTIFPMKIIERAYRGMSEYTIVDNHWSHPKRFDRIVVGCDFARSANVGADYSVFTVLGVDEYGKFWLLYQWRKRGATFNEQIARLKKINQDFNPQVIMVESNQMQSIFGEKGREEDLPIIDHHTGTNKYDFEKGLPALAVLFEQEKIKFPRGDQRSRDVVDTIAMELQSITWTEKGRLEGTDDHDDTAMSLWIAVTAAHYVNEDFIYGFL